MKTFCKYRFLLLTPLLIAAVANAATLTVSTFGQFGAVLTDNGPASPNSMWQLAFNVDESPVPEQADAVSAKIPFSNFQYSVDGSNVDAQPDTVWLYTADDGGGMTVFFGGETDTFAPQFIFLGDALFSGSSLAPQLSIGTYGVSSQLYLSGANFDAHVGNPISITQAASQTPEAPTGLLVVSGMLLSCLGVWRRFPTPDRSDAQPS